MIIENSVITIRPDNGISIRNAFIEWNKVGTKRYRTYYSLFSTENAAKINLGYRFKSDWNTAVPYSVVDQILKDKSMSVI